MSKILSQSIPGSSVSSLRKQLRHQRRQLSERQQQKHSKGLAYQVVHHPRFLSAKRIACYLANDGEIDPGEIIRCAWQRGKQIYLPVLQAFKNSLHFALYEPGSLLLANRYGIEEPVTHPRNYLSAKQIDLMLVPLVAFDEHNNRLGMGGGFYDRSLHHRNLFQHSRKPYLIGIAHDFQKAVALHNHPWDVQMDTIATEKQSYRVKT